MKLQIKNSHKVIIGITILVAALFITAFKAKESIGQAQNAPSSLTRSDSHCIDIGILISGDKVEALRKFITGWQEVQE